MEDEISLESLLPCYDYFHLEGSAESLQQMRKNIAEHTDELSEKLEGLQLVHVPQLYFTLAAKTTKTGLHSQKYIFTLSDDIVELGTFLKTKYVVRDAVQNANMADYRNVMIWKKGMALPRMPQPKIDALLQTYPQVQKMDLKESYQEKPLLHEGKLVGDCRYFSLFRGPIEDITKFRHALSKTFRITTSEASYLGANIYAEDITCYRQ